MSLNWKTISSEHVRNALILLQSGTRIPAIKSAGLYLEFQGVQYPAKAVLASAYRIANGLAPDVKLKFSSGEGTIERLRALGFIVGRKAVEDVASVREST